MRALSMVGIALIGSAFLVVAGCGSSSENPSSPDGAIDLKPGIPDSSPAVDLIKTPDTLVPDLPPPSDGPADTPPTVDTPVAPVDGSPLDVMASEAGTVDVGVKLDVGSPVDSRGGSDATDGPADAAPDAAPDGFVPGPATAVVVNSSNTATFSLANGTWKVFYFDATAGQLYCISNLSGITRGYVSTSPSVSPTDYQYVTSADGTLAFRAANTQRHYVAVAVNGGGASGSFQVADGGQLLALGANTVTLAAPDMDNYYFFRFPITAGHAYSVSITGTSTTSVGLGLSPMAERASNGQFSTPLRGVSGPLPINNEDIPSTSVALSYSGFYFLFLHMYSATNATITVTQTS